MSHSIPTPDFMAKLDPTRDYKINVRSNNPNPPGQKEPSFISVAHPGLLSDNPNVLSTFNNESSEHCTLNFVNDQGENVVSRGESLDEAELGAFLEFDEVTQEFYLTLLDAQYMFGDPLDQESVQDNLLSEIEAALEDIPQPDNEPDPLPQKVTRPIDPPSKPTTSSRSQLKVTSPTRKKRSPAPRPNSNSNPTLTNQPSSEITNLSDKLNSAHLNKSSRSPVKKPNPTTKPKPKSKPTKPEKVPSPEAASPPADDDSFGCFDLIGIDAKSEPEVEPNAMEEVEFSDFGDEIFEDVDDSLVEEPVKIPSPEPVIKPAPEPVIKPAPKPTVKPPVKPASKPVHKRTGVGKKETTQKKYRSSSSESSSSSSGSSSSGSGSSSSGSSSSSSGSSSDSDSDSNSDSEEDKKPPAKSKSKPKTKPKSKPKSPPAAQPLQPAVETTKGFSDNDFADIGAEAASGLSDQFDEVDFGFDQPSEPLPAIDLFQAKSSSEDEAPAPVLPPSTAAPAPPQLNSSDFSSDNDQRYEKVTLNFSDDDDNSFDLV